MEEKEKTIAETSEIIPVDISFRVVIDKTILSAITSREKKEEFVLSVILLTIQNSLSELSNLSKKIVSQILGEPRLIIPGGRNE